MSTPPKTSVTILWHMHQPWYGDARTGRMLMPWVRFHALKDYLDMVAVVQAQGVPCSFNLVPSLLLQIQQYVDGQTSDAALDLCRRAPDELDIEDRRWLLENAFKCNWERLVEPNKRFAELLDLRGRNLAHDGLERAIRRFGDAELRDLQVHLHLAWCGWELRTHEPVVTELLAKGRDYTEDEKQALLDRLDVAMAGVIPRYVQAAKDGLIELSTTPFYHPILPLLNHYQDVLAALPGCRLPPGVEDVPEDARTQLARGRELFERLLGFAPVGLWPSEGSVSHDVMAMASELGFRWAATDEHILGLSLQHHADPARQGGRRPTSGDYLQPWQHAGLSMFFRHHQASDKIGFDYAGWGTEEAVTDFIRLLERTAANAKGVERPVIPVVLDGENCWEYYRNNGHDFLVRLYQALQKHAWLEPVTFSDHLKRAPEPPRLDYLFPGSWINHDFYIWAGHREDQRAWELLFMTRKALVAAEEALPEEVRRRAWEHVYIAEGSDWFWWYGDDHSSSEDSLFDYCFRQQLIRVYELLGAEPPSALAEPIAGLAPPSPLTPPVAPFTPQLDGRETDFFEWRAAGRIEGRGPAGAMSRGGSAGYLGRVRYGFDDTRLYLAIELNVPTGQTGPWSLRLEWTADGKVTRVIVPEPQARAPKQKLALDQPVGQVAELAIDRLLELGLPREALPAAPGGSAELVIELCRANESVERWPERGAFDFPVPEESDWLSQWIV